MCVKRRDAGLRASSKPAVRWTAVPLAVLRRRVGHVDADAGGDQGWVPVDEDVEMGMHVEDKRFLGFGLESSAHRELERIAWCVPDQLPWSRRGLVQRRRWAAGGEQHGCYRAQQESVLAGHHNKKMAQLKRGDKALVTGASSGIGVAYADALAARGLNLVLVARREDRLRDLATRLHREFGIDAQALRADLTDAADLARVEDALRSGGIDLLINNAGYGAYMLFVDLPPDRAEELLRLKVIASTRLARAVLPSM